MGLVAVLGTLLSFGAVLELKRQDGGASRIEFGVGPDGAESYLSGDAFSINASVPLASPNLESMLNRIQFGGEAREV